MNIIDINVLFRAVATKIFSVYDIFCGVYTCTCISVLNFDFYLYRIS